MSSFDEMCALEQEIRDLRQDLLGSKTKLLQLRADAEAAVSNQQELGRRCGTCRHALQELLASPVVAMDVYRALTHGAHKFCDELAAEVLKLATFCNNINQLQTSCSDLELVIEQRLTLLASYGQVLPLRK